MNKLNDYLINEEKLYLFKCLKDKEENQVMLSSHFNKKKAYKKH